MKYYFYVSEAKLEMLKGQIPEPLKQKYSAEFGINWGVVTAKAGAEVEAGRAPSQLEAVSQFVINEKQPGSLQDAREWALDRMRVKHVSVRENTNLFLLVGKKDGVYHCLGGSTHHVTGNHRGEDVNVGLSYFPYMARAIDKEFSEAGIQARDGSAELFGNAKVRDTFGGVRTHEWADAIRALYEWNDAPTFEVAFLARFLAYGRSLYQDYCAVWSPLYVELK